MIDHRCYARVPIIIQTEVIAWPFNITGSDMMDDNLLILTCENHFIVFLLRVSDSRSFVGYSHFVDSQLKCECQLDGCVSRSLISYSLSQVCCVTVT